MRRIPASLTVVMLAASGHPVTTATLRSWVHRGHITRGQGGYDLQEILTYIEHRESKMTKHVLTIAQLTDSSYRLVLDGQDIANSVSALTIDMTRPGALPYVALTLPIHHIGMHSKAEVVVDNQTREALLKLGWTEPKAA